MTMSLLSTFSLGITRHNTSKIEVSDFTVVELMFLQNRSRLVRRADNLTAIWADSLDNVELLSSHNSISLHGLLWG
jgi:hypothetical protein